MAFPGFRKLMLVSFERDVFEVLPTGDDKSDESTDLLSKWVHKALKLRFTWVDFLGWRLGGIPPLEKWPLGVLSNVKESRNHIPSRNAQKHTLRNGWQNGHSLYC